MHVADAAAHGHSAWAWHVSVGVITTHCAEFMHVKPGKGAAVVRSKLKSLKRGTIQEKTFRAGEPLQKADINGRTCMLSYTEVRLKACKR